MIAIASFAERHAHLGGCEETSERWLIKVLLLAPNAKEVLERLQLGWASLRSAKLTEGLAEITFVY